MSNIEQIIEKLASEIVKRIGAKGYLEFLASEIAEEVLHSINENAALGQAIAKHQDELTREAEERADHGIVTENSKPILCLDFDGVCHSYTSGWQGADNIPDPPVDGLFGFLEEADKHFRIAIFSSRSNQPGGIAAMKAWFAKHGLIWSRDRPDWDAWTRLEFPKEKPSAMVTIDDRCIRFEGHWPSVEDLRQFKPWTKF